MCKASRSFTEDAFTRSVSVRMDALSRSSGAPALSPLGAGLGTALGVVTVTLDLFSVNKQIVGVRCSHGKMAPSNDWYGCSLALQKAPRFFVF